MPASSRIDVTRRTYSAALSWSLGCRSAYSRTAVRGSCAGTTARLVRGAGVSPAGRVGVTMYPVSKSPYVVVSSG